MKNPISKTLLWLCISAIFTTQCQMYHLVDVEVQDFNDNPNKRSRLSYHLIIHLADQTMVELVNPKMKENSLVGLAIPVGEDLNRIYQHALSKNNFRGKVRKNKMYLNQLHLFVNKAIDKNSQVEISFNELQKVQVLDKNRGLTTLSTIAIGVPSIYASFIIYLMIVCNCPHAYVQNGSTWEFTNTLYTGAVHPALERYDFKTLQDFRPGSSSYALQIRNELDEIQYTNELKLLAVYHQVGETVVSDQFGKIYGVTQKIQPIKVTDDAQNSMIQQVLEADDDAYAFESSDDSDFSHLYVNFETKNGLADPILVLRAKNSNWGGFVYHEFTKLFGAKYDEWVASNAHKTKEQLAKNIDRTGMLLSVEIKDGKNWKQIAKIQLVGERSYNDIAIQIPAQYRQQTHLQFRLKSGFHFWDLDQIYVASTSQDGLQFVEYTANAPYNSAANNELLDNDINYFVHKKGEAPLEIVFDGLRPEPRTLFLKSKGYYRSNQEFEGKPNYAALLQIRKNGGFSAFSKEQFEEILLLNTYLSEIPIER